MMKGKIQHQISNLQWFTFSPNLCEKRSINSSGYDFLSFLFPKEGFTWAPMGKRSVFTKPSHNALDHDYNYNKVSFLFLFFPPLFLCYIKKKKNSLRLLLEHKNEPALPDVPPLICSLTSNPSKQHTPSQNGNFHKRWRTEILLTGSLESFLKT